MKITHKFVSEKPASSDATKIDGPKWNDDHEVLSAAVVPVTGTSRTVLPADEGDYLRFTNTVAKTATFNTADGFASGQEFHLANRATANLTLNGTVTLNPPKGGTLVLEPGDTVTVKFVSATVADVMGSTGAA